MRTRVVKVDPEKPNVVEIEQAAELLDAGGLVAFPTETVYGIGCAAQVESLERLDRVKERKNKKPYTVHIGQKVDVKKYVPQIGLRLQKLIKKAWPGPLTIVFELAPKEIEQQRGRFDIGFFDGIYKDNSVGIRCPDNPIASQLLRQCRSTIAAPSANTAGRQPATDANEVFAQLDGRVDLIVDGGPCRYKMSSTVVKLGKKGWQLLREGVYSKRDIEEMGRVNILFVCTGNTCRSPMAEGIYGKYLAEKLGCDVDCLGQMGYKISSAGVMAIAGVQASKEAVATCAEAGVDISGRRSRPISAALAAESDYIFVMCQNHRQHIVGLWPEAAEKCRLLVEDAGIPDPVGQGRDIFDKTRHLIEDGLSKRISELVL